jgi:hypothetical protein
MSEDYNGVSADDLTQLSGPASDAIKAKSAKEKEMRHNAKLCSKAYPARKSKAVACGKRLNKLEGDDLDSAREHVEIKIKIKAECKIKFPGSSNRALTNRRNCEIKKEATKDVSDDTDLELTKKVDALAEKAVAKAAKAQAKLEKK